MRVAVASGKGGTGKTTVAVSLALALEERGHGGGKNVPRTMFLDCDVEAPDAHLFLQPEIRTRKPVVVPVPNIDPSRCVLCGDCANVCRFNALAILGEEVLVLPELCHGCGSCVHVCQARAIYETPREIGFLEAGMARGVQFAQGVLNVGEGMAVPVIKELKKWMWTNGAGLVVLDAPPGTSCPVVETISGSDFVLLVTEPTPFGLHDLELAADVVRKLELPFGVIINRNGIGNGRVEEFCHEQGIPILMKIPFDRGIAEGIAKGKPLLAIRPDLRFQFDHLIERIEG
jgi:MinD superfamily P-loop ATPase